MTMPIIFAGGCPQFPMELGEAAARALVLSGGRGFRSGHVSREGNPGSSSDLDDRALCRARNASARTMLPNMRDPHAGFSAALNAAYRQ